MGREPQQGTDGKQEQNRPWAKSQIGEWKASRSRDSRRQRANFWGWVAGAGTAMGREPKQGTDGKQEQGNRGKVLTHGTDNSKATGAKC